MSTQTTRQAYLLACKKRLRATMRSNLKSMPLNEILDQSTLVTSHVTSHPAFQRAKAVSCYLSMPFGELDTSMIVRSILQSGKTLFVPRVDNERGEMDMLRVYDEQDLTELSTGTWGIKEPGIFKDGHRRGKATDPNGPRLDLILLPGLAFDYSMARLGHGKGYYDRFLSSYMVHRCVESGKETQDMPVLLGLALTPQLLDLSSDPIPTGDHDWRVNGVVYPGGFVSPQEH